MTLVHYGYSTLIEKSVDTTNLNGLELGRIIAAHKDRYSVITEGGELTAEITGNLRYTATSKLDFPTVGDWVALQVYEGDHAIIHKLLPRYALLSRKAIGTDSNIQLIGANIDYALIIQAVDRDFNVNRIERYLTLCHTSSITPILLLNKIDMISGEELDVLLDDLKSRVPEVPVFPISITQQLGIAEVESMIQKEKTYALLGSSGVGKSSLVNCLSQEALMPTKDLGRQSNRGQHTTTYRQLILLNKGGILVDNPGMREVGIANATDGVERTFDTIHKLALDCRFADCTHTVEKDCAVLEGVASGLIAKASYDNYQKMNRERMHFEASVAERRKQDKDFGKMIKQVKKVRKNNKY
ncbi:ribosome small subunit-dependent GTPase A [Muricauda sp. 2012CJ35-5]|uniref:Small ribosomal subunit biogenesis GTPase RsgA n=1 Tax=Flagellimonas spongiicola TaxID=2942208 RepID=A0ABT0PPJ0_9FLAO|nr:ribosome small subunit-dependent GTPase A [Allomuricauda spongiicola]MCL6273299.1 ribosome small subunit-dependent GTPase A [Allomuricauda spongiicola]